MQVEPLESGYRWVLTYNLINASKFASQTASFLDSQINQTMSLLRHWRNLGDGSPSYLIYPLNHDYTARGLSLAMLKGDDYHRARHIAQSCDHLGGYFMLLANMELHSRYDNCANEHEEPTDRIYLTHVVDIQGHVVSMWTDLQIVDDNLLRTRLYVYEDRRPDVQRGGGYTGNNYCEIDQYFQDSVGIIKNPGGKANIIA